MKQPTAQQETEFVQLVQQYQRLVYKVCGLFANDNEERKDLFQEIILQAWKAYPGFKGQSSVSTWLYRISLNTAITYQKKQKRGPAIIYPDELVQHPEDNLPDTWKEEYKILHQMIAGLPKLDRALVLLYLEDKSHNEIADIMGISASNVGTKLNRIKDKMKQQAQILIQQ